ncbi:hypothetical protein L7F22_028313 [Adiantum nelumboides]|nr:hypothetical protein [Adiantum nelumboides]
MASAPHLLSTSFQCNGPSFRHISDRVFDRFVPKSGTGKLSFPDLYTAVLLVYNDFNKNVPGPHLEPPTREEVHALFQKFDKNKDNELSREEFALLMEKFTSKLVEKAGKTFLIFCIIAPALAFLAKGAIEGLPGIGEYARKIPTPIYASIVTALVILVQSLYHRKWKV